MNSIGKITEELINKSPFLREAMTDDLINISALVRMLKPEIISIYGKNVKDGAVVMAIKRLTPGLYHKLNVKIANVLGELGDFLVRSNLTDYTYENSETLKYKQTELIQEINKDNDTFFTLCKGVTETTFVLSANQMETIERIFKQEKLKSNNLDLASITVKLPLINTEIFGIYYYILKHLAWEGINIIEVMSTSNEFTVIVRQDDVDHAFKILMKIKRGK
jgi:hypothetical protein